MGCAHPSAPPRDMKSLGIPFIYLDTLPTFSKLKLGVGEEWAAPILRPPPRVMKSLGIPFVSYVNFVQVSSKLHFSRFGSGKATETLATL